MTTEQFLIMWSWIVFAILSLVDINVTMRAIVLGGKDVNPLARWVQKWMGEVEGTIVSKIVLGVVVALASSWVGEKVGESWALGVVTVANMWSGWLWLRNHRAIKDLEGEGGR